jgi:hypothetical protein
MAQFKPEKQQDKQLASKGETTMDASFWKSMGVTTTQDAPLIEEVQRLNRAAAGREIQQITPMDIPYSERKAKP